MSAEPSKPVIGVVGGIGSGKSEVARLLALDGGQLILADQLGHDALRDPLNRERVLALWPEVLGADDAIDRRVLGRIVFADPTARAQLEAISLPWINQRIHTLLDAGERDERIGWSVLDAAIMLETGWNHACTRIVYVHAPRSARIARVALRGWNEEELQRRESAQWSLARKAMLATDAILNDASREVLMERIARWRMTWQRSAKESFAMLS